MSAHTDNALIANILQKDLEMPVDTWVQEVRQPLMPFVTSLQSAIKKAAPGLKQSALYNPRTRQRQCFMQVRWRYLHDKLPPVAQTTMSAFVRIGDYHDLNRRLSLAIKNEEVAATVHFVAREAKAFFEEQMTEKEILDNVMKWKQKRKPPLEEKGAAMMVLTLNMLSWIKAKASDELPIAEEDILLV